jgi:hypothetical protein
MKNRMSCKRVIALAVAALSCQIATVLVAQDAAPPPASPGVAAAAPASEAQPVQLSSGVSEILKLARARVSDDIITAFIGSSGRTYHLSASEILYLRGQGVSDSVLTAMLSQRENAAAAAAQAAPPPAPTGPTSVWANSNPQPAPVAAQPVPQAAPTFAAAAVPVYAQPAPVYAYPAPSYGYYGGGFHGGGGGRH